MPPQEGMADIDQTGGAMAMTMDAAKVRKLESDLAAERQRSRKAEQANGGLRSLNTRLNTTRLREQQQAKPESRAV
jgi:hypothetical protein